MAAAKAIENQLQADLFVQEANAHASELNATMDAISEGVLAWTAQGIVMHLNHQAGQLLGLSPTAVVGRPLAEYLTLPEGLAQAVARGEELSDVEMAFRVDGAQRECLVSLRVIRNPQAEPVTYIATLRRIEQVRQLVTRLVGAQARLPYHLRRTILNKQAPCRPTLAITSPSNPRPTSRAIPIGSLSA